MNDATKKFLKHLLRWTIMAVIFLFLGMYLYRNWQKIKDVEFQFNWFYLVAAIIAFGFDYFIQLVVYRMLLKAMGIRLGWVKSLGLYCLPQLGKYVPGKVVSAAGVMYIMKREGYRPEEGLALAILFLAIALTGGLVTGLVFLPFSPGLWDIPAIRLLPIILPLLIIGLWPRFFYSVLNFALRVLKRSPLHQSLTYASALRIMLVASVRWAVLGVTFWLFARAMFPVDLKVLPLLTTALCVSYVVGYAALIAPAGLGVREAVMLVALGQFFSPGQAALLTASCRLWLTLGELFITLIGAILYIRQTRMSVSELKSAPELETSANSQAGE
jgi:uncharacterized membrane protein YbhN (UPF0104 family)